MYCSANGLGSQKLRQIVKCLQAKKYTYLTLTEVFYITQNKLFCFPFF